MFKVEFETINDDFAEDDIAAIRTALNDIIEKVELGHLHGRLRDANGNAIGGWTYTKD